jgi:hypothetical protein
MILISCCYIISKIIIRFAVGNDVPHVVGALLSCELRCCHVSHVTSYLAVAKIAKICQLSIFLQDYFQAFFDWQHSHFLIISPKSFVRYIKEHPMLSNHPYRYSSSGAKSNLYF